MAFPKASTWLPLLTLSLGLAAAIAAAIGQQQSNQAAISQLLDRTADEAASNLTSRMALYEHGLQGAHGVVVGAGGMRSGLRDRFRQYWMSRDIDAEYPGARGFGFISRVRQGAEDAFVRRQQADGAARFEIQELAKHDGEHYVITHVEPLERNGLAVGLDIGSEATRRRGARAAMQSGRATLTGPITLVQATGKKNRSMLFLLPVYRDGGLPAPSRRDAAAIGWVYAPLVTDEILASFDAANSDYRFVLRDVTERTAPTEIFASQTGTGLEGPDTLVRRRQFPIYGRQWEVVLHPNAGFVANLGMVSPVSAGAVTGGASALLALTLFLVLSARERRVRAHARRARLAAIAESSHDAIIATDVRGHVTEWNPAAEALFGRPASEAVGRTLVELIVPLDRVLEDARVLEAACAGRNTPVLETVRQGSDGTSIEVELSAAPIRSRRSRISGVAITIRDVRERNRSARQIRELNANLEAQVRERTAELAEFSVLQRAILANAGYGIIATDPEGAITLFNPAAEQILGYSARQMLGQTPAIFHDPSEVAARALALQQELGRPIEPGFEVFIAKAGDTPDVNEWTYISAQGRRIPVLLNVSALRHDDGSLLGYLGIAADLTEQKAREAALAVSERKLRELFELSPLGIALTDGAGRFIEFNAAFQKLTGYTPHELRSMKYPQLTPPEYDLQEQAVLAVIDASGKYGPYEKQYIRKDGSLVPVRLNGVGLSIEDRPHVWSIVEDITHQRLAESVLVDAVAAAEGASRAKSDFLANMSHEIRTPMNAILGMLKLMRRTSLDNRQLDYTNKTEAAAKTLLMILNDILDFSKIEAGRQVLEAHPFNIDSVMRDLAVILGGNAGDKDIEVVYEIPAGLPDTVIGDSLRLQQVLINLAGNAIKFTQVGEVVVAVRVVERREQRITLQFEVRDTGIGIDRDQLLRIFEGFTQAEASTTRRFGGTGLGLAISQRLVDLMGGELQVESERGRGSRFHFTVSFDVPQAAAGTARRETLPASLQALRVLVVDDNEVARTAMRELLAPLGWDIDLAEDGPSGLARVEASRLAGRPYDVVFIDWRMPGMDGWETSQRIRVGVNGGHEPLIVMVTAFARELLAERSLDDRSVLDGFLVKPVTASVLLDAVADARLARMSGPFDPDAAGASPDLYPRRLGGLRILVVEDNPANQQVAFELLSAEGAQVTLASAGAEAIRLVLVEAVGFDAVLMDIQMPDMDGFTATRRLRAGLGGVRLPIIAMTANVLQRDREASLAAGMDDHIGKPFDLDELVARLLYWTGARSSGREAVPHTAIAPPDVVPPLLDAEGALKRFAGRQEALDRTLDRFPRASKDLQASLVTAARAGDAASVVRHLHTLKGIAATVGADRLADQVRRLELALESGADVDMDGVEMLDELLDETIAAIPTAGASRAPAPMPASSTTSGPLPRALRSRLEDLLSLLRASNLQALGAFAGARDELGRYDESGMARIETALDRLDLTAAATAVQDVLDGRTP